MTREITLSNGKTATLEGLKPKKSLSELLHGVKGFERVDKVLIIILDSSGSMCERMEGSSKIDTAWKVLKTDLMPNMGGWTYGIMTFGGWMKVDWEVYPCQDTKALAVINTPYAAGSTPMRQALEKSWDWVRKHAKQARFVLLSDGEPTDSSKEEILNLARENKSIPIDTVGIGSGLLCYDPVFLLNLSTITGGTFVEANSVKKLANTILKLSPTNRPLLGMVKER